MTQETRDLSSMTDVELAQMALTFGSYDFGDLGREELLKGDDLFVRVGVLDDGEFVELGTEAYGSETAAAEFEPNTSPVGGKLATVVKCRMDSAAAYQRFGDKIPEGPQRWKGGVYHVARVLLPDGTWKIREFVGAASGVQSSYDEAVTRKVLGVLGALWEQRELSLAAAAAAPAPAEA